MEPEDIHREFTVRLLKKDLDALSELFEDDAVFVVESGEEVRGRAAIRQQLEQFVPIAESMQPVSRTIFVSGDTALVNLGWSAEVDGETKEFNALEVIARGEDGLWRYRIDNPFGH